MLKRLFEKWFNLEPEICLNCEFVKSILEAERREKLLIIERLTAKEEKPIEVPKPTDFQPVGSRQIPWSVRRQQLERADRLKFENDRANEIAKMEDELKING